MDKTYEIIRFFGPKYQGAAPEVIKCGLTFEEAKEWCNRDDTHEFGEWFDGMREE